MKSHHVDLLNEAIAPALTRLALPIMATSLVQMLYNLTDMAWIGRLGAGAVTAVGSAGMYTWFSQGFAILARTGGQVKTAHCLGAGENDSAAQYARGALQLGILFAVLYGLVSLFGASRLIGFFKLNSPEVIAQAEWYVRIACGLVIFSYLNAILTGLLTAAWGLCTTFLLIGMARPLFSIFLHEEKVMAIGVNYLRIVGLSQMFMMVEQTSIGAFSGLGRTLYPSIVSVTFTSARIPVAVLLSSVMGLSGIWWALSISSMVKGCILFVSFVVFLYVFLERKKDEETV